MRAQPDTWEYLLAMLTTREHQIACLVSEGLSNREVGERLNLAEGTIKVHLHNIYEKLAINNRTVLAALFASSRLGFGISRLSVESDLIGTGNGP